VRRCVEVASVCCSPRMRDRGGRGGGGGGGGGGGRGGARRGGGCGATPRGAELGDHGPDGGAEEGADPDDLQLPAADGALGPEHRHRPLERLVVGGTLRPYGGGDPPLVRPLPRRDYRPGRSGMDRSSHTATTNPASRQSAASKKAGPSRRWSRLQEGGTITAMVPPPRSAQAKRHWQLIKGWRTIEPWS